MLQTVLLLFVVLGTEWRAGVGVANITPTTPMWMSGYASRARPAEGKLTDLWAKAVVLGHEKGPQAVVIAYDLVGIDQQTGETLAKAAMDVLKLPREAVLLNCSHTHSGPVVGGNLAPMYALDSMQTALIERYGSHLEQQTKAAVEAAVKDFAPAKLSFSDDTATFAVNRRNNKEAKIEELRVMNSLIGPVDHRVRLLAVERPDGTVRALLYSYACHATVLSGFEWCGDYPGYAAIDLETRHPGAAAVFLAGCGADQNPLPRRKVELAKQYGTMLADGVDRALAKPRSAISPGVTFRSFERTPLQFASVPTAAELDNNEASKDRYVAARARLLKRQLAADGTIDDHYQYPVMTWRLGKELTWAALGGEVVVDYSLRLKRELGDDLWVLGYSHDVMAYIPSERVLKEGRYEGKDSMVFYGLPSAWKEGVEEAVVGSVKRQVELMNSLTGESVKP
jgi:neutral ceramidase